MAADVIPADATPVVAMVDLHWIPLGADGWVVRQCGRLYERLRAHLERREPRSLYHGALEVQVAEGRFTIELTPVPDDDGASRGAVVEGPVGSRWLGRWRMFRYELRCWNGGVIPDLEHAAGPPQRLCDEAGPANRLLELVPTVPTPVWGRDELRTGDMWNSNSVIAWLIASSGLPIALAQPPPGGRAPGWNAGVELARRQAGRAHRSADVAPPV